MKKFLEYATSFKAYSCMNFTGFMIAWVFAALILSWEGLPISIILQGMLISVVISLIQMLSFTDLAFKKMRYGGRLTFFAVMTLATLSLFAVLFKWFPLDKIGYWLGFAGIFLVVFVAISIGFSVYFKVTGKKYNELLGEAQKK